jgi:DNA modification methylase
MVGHRNRDGAGAFAGDCRKCGATRVDSQIGLEQTPQEYVDRMVGVFREVRRVLRDDGTCWVNLGDSYASAVKGSGGPSDKQLSNAGSFHNVSQRLSHGLKDKDLVGIPWRIAFALQADGWYLRSDIIWSKPNPMPESVTDRPTKAHEYVFLLAKRERYFFDQDAVKEQSSGLIGGRFGSYPDSTMRRDAERDRPEDNGTRNIRTVWEIATQPYPESHFATFPEELAIRCIKAGSSEKGCCAECGAPRERVTKRGELVPDAPGYTARGTIRGNDGFVKNAMTPAGATQGHPNFHYESKTLGWQPTCKHDAPTKPCIVLDPFGGAGTVALVADKLNRTGIALELKREYCQMARKRCYDDSPLFA